MERIGKEGSQIFETREELRVGKDAVDEVDGQIVGHHNLLGQTVEYPEYSNTKLGARERIATIKLWDEVGCLDDRTCNELREEANIESEIKDVTYRTNKALVNIGGVGDNLERIE